MNEKIWKSFQCHGMSYHVRAVIQCCKFSTPAKTALEQISYEWEEIRLIRSRVVAVYCPLPYRNYSL
jgi:hypothetical protein